MIQGITFIYWLIAYGGALIHVLMKLSETKENEKILSAFTRKDKLVTVASLVAIPILLIIMTDSAIVELLPLNYITSFLVGYQTQSFLRSFVMIAGSKYKTNENNTSDSGSDSHIN